jgi:hypothetical protein
VYKKQATVKQNLKTGVILPASEKAILEQAPKVVVSRVAELASQKKPLEVEVTSSLSEAGPLQSPTLKHAPRGAGVYQVTGETTSKHKLKEVEALKTSQTLETGTLKQLSQGDSTTDALEANKLKNSPRGMDMFQVTDAVKQLSVTGTSISTDRCMSQATEGGRNLLEHSIEVGISKQNKGSTEQDEEGILDVSLPTSSSLSPHNSIDSTCIITAACSVKNSTSAKLSDGTSSIANSIPKTSESAKASEKGDFIESAKSSVCRGSNSSGVSDESTCSSLSSSVNKPHKSNDLRWEAIRVVRVKDGILGLSHFRLLKRLGCGDIGSVYLSELSGMRCFFAMKVMDKGSLASRKKLLRAQTEREILQSLDHPFLPTLYTHFETDKFSCLVMEYCPGGDLHTLRQRQPGKHFSEQAVRYVSQTLVRKMLVTCLYSID